jgi:electron transfer flavoprotein beta subunit
MNIIVITGLVPDLVEELEIDSSGTALDTAWLRMIINEFDDHAIEQAILLKERDGAHVTVVAINQEGIDEVLFTAAAKEADRLVKLVGNFEEGLNSHALARVFAEAIKGLAPDLILTGVQAHTNMDGAVGSLLASLLDMPYVGYIAGVNAAGGKVVAKKEYPGGLIGEMEVTLPAVLGIQASEQPPRYVAVSKVRQVMKTATIEEQDVAALDPSGGLAVGRMFRPEMADRATMIEGSEEEIAAKLVELFKEVGAL